LRGARVIEVEALGKHMLVHFDREVQLRVHLGMHGSWHRYPTGVRWKRSPKSAAVVLETERTSLVCFDPMEVEVIPTPQRHWHRQLSNLGPDLLGDQEPDWSQLVARCRLFHPAGDSLGEVLLDQRVAAGLGNVYKSEVPFMGPLEEDPFSPSERAYSPWAAWQTVPKDDLIALWRRGRHLLQANLGGWQRTTRVDRRTRGPHPEGALYVYGRVGRPCFRCGEEIARDYQGLQNRVTYWCPDCQGPSPTANPGDSGRPG
jgi:endonuclease-8